MYRTIILHVFYGCDAWSLTLREERRLRVFENKVLRGIFGPKREEVTEERRRLHNKGFMHVLLTRYHSGDQINKDVIGKACSTHGKRRGEET